MEKALDPPAVKFLREDHHAVDDAFGAHSRVAEALASTLLLDPPLRVIGLLGPWGSGKSRVVALARARLKGRQMRFFEFDAWLHQSDAPRRAFLEVLLEWLKAEKLGNTDALQARLDQLLGKIERTESTVTPRISKRVSLLLIVLLLVPFALPFLRPDWLGESRFGTTTLFGTDVSRAFLTALILAALPVGLLTLVTLGRFVAAGAVGLWGLGRRLFKRPMKPGRKSDPGASLVGVFANKVSEHREDVKTRDPDPTTLEFQDFLSRILQHVGKHTTDRVVFVVDNLDRLPADEAVELWGTIRGLFHGALASPSSPVSPPTVILPFDETVLKLQGETGAAGFVEKTFDVVFRLPTPVLTQWQDYLRGRLQEVFGTAFEAQWADAAARILEGKGLDGRTPRSLNAFINETATLWLQWRNEPVSFAAIAYYVAHRTELDAPWPKLRDGPGWMSQFDPDWTTGVAALRYGAKPEIAGQILIEGPLQQAILDLDLDAFDALSRRTGFPGVLRRQTDVYAYGEVGPPVSHVALLLDRLPDQDNSDVRGAWRNASLGVLRQQSWRPRTARDAEALQLILRREPAGGRAALLAAAVASVFHLQDGEVRTAARHVLAALEVIARFSTEAGVPAPTARVQGDPDVQLELLAAAGPESPALRLLEFPTAARGHLEALLKRVTPQPAAPESAELVRAFVAWAPKIDWTLAVNRLTNELQDLRTQDDFRGELETLLLLWSAAPEARDPIRAYVRSSRFQAALGDAISLGRGPDLPFRLALAIFAGAVDQRSPQHWQELLGARPELGETVEELLARYGAGWGLLDIVDAGLGHVRSQPLMRAIAVARLKGRPGELSAADLAANLERLETLFDPSAQDLWRELAQRPKAWPALGRAGDPAAVRRAARGVLQLDIPWESRAPAARVMAPLLGGLPPAEWQDDILTAGDAFTDLRLISPAGPELTVGGGLEKGLERTVRQVLKSSDRSVIERWREAAERLPRAARDRLYARLAADVLTEANDPHTVLDVLGEPLFAPLSERPDEIVTHLLAPLLERHERLDWVATHLEPLADAAGRASQESRATLRARIDTTRARGAAVAVLDALDRLDASAAAEGRQDGRAD